MKCLPLLVHLLAPSPSSPSERLDCSEGGNTGRRTMGPAVLWTAVRSASGHSTECGGYRDFGPKRKRLGKIGPNGGLKRGPRALIGAWKPPRARRRGSAAGRATGAAESPPAKGPKRTQRPSGTSS